MYICVYIYLVQDRNNALKHTDQYRSITFQLSIRNGLWNEIQNLGGAHHG